jgi:hypothetical protein
MYLAIAPAVACNAAEPAGGAGGAGGAAAQPFHFATVNDGAVSVTVRDASGPVSGAHVVVRAPALDDAGTLGDLLWQGMSGGDGHATGKLSRSADLTHVVLLVTAAGHTGPYDDEAARTAYGVFGPAAWITVPVGDLDGYDLRLTAATGSP